MALPLNPAASSLNLMTEVPGRRVDSEISRAEPEVLDIPPPEVEKPLDFCGVKPLRQDTADQHRPVQDVPSRTQGVSNSRHPDSQRGARTPGGVTMDRSRRVAATARANRSSLMNPPVPGDLASIQDTTKPTESRPPGQTPRGSLENSSHVVPPPTPLLPGVATDAVPTGRRRLTKSALTSLETDTGQWPNTDHI